MDGRNGFDALDNSDAVEVVEISGRTYALVASWGDSAIQVADITDPANPSPSRPASLTRSRDSRWMVRLTCGRPP